MKFVALLTLVLLSKAFSQDTWAPLPSPTQRDLRKLSFIDSLNGWVAGDSGTILRTTNGGQSWTHQNSGVTESFYDIFFLNERQGWAVAPWYNDTAIYSYFLSTTNGGDIWQSQFWLGEFFRTVYFRDSLVGWLGTGGSKILKTTDRGTTWTETVLDLSFPIHNIKFYSPTYGFAMGGRLEIAGVVWRTTTAGDTWSATIIAPDPINDIHYFDSLNIFGLLSDPDYFGTGVVTTTDGGENWDYRYVAIWGDALALAVRTRAEMWVPLGFAAEYMWTLDSGCTWCSRLTPDTTAVYDAVFTDSLTGYMVGDRGTILKYVGPPPQMISLSRSLLIFDSANNRRDSVIVRNCGSGSLAVDSVVLFSSEPSSYSLTIQPSSFTLGYGDSQVVHVQMTAVVLSPLFDFEDSLLVYSNDPLDPVKIIVVRGDTIITGVLHEKTLPIMAILFQNYPNPFNPTTVIAYKVPVRGMTSLKVYNLLGQEIATLVDEVKESGSYKVSFDATGLPGGVYFYRLRTGIVIQTRKLTLLR